MSAPSLVLPETDDVGIGARGGQQGHRRRNDRQSDQRALGLDPGQHLPHRGGGLLAALAHVEMRVGAIADKRVDQIDHAVGHVGVQVEGRGDRHVGADDLPHHREQCALRVVVLGGHRGAVGADVDRIDRQGGGQPGADRVEQFDEEGVADRQPFGSVIASAMPIGVHGPALSIAATKPGVSGQHRRRHAPRLAHDVVALEIGAGEKMRLGRGRGEPVALDRKPHQGDARRGSAWRAVPRRSRDALISATGDSDQIESGEPSVVNPAKAVGKRRESGNDGETERPAWSSGRLGGAVAAAVIGEEFGRRSGGERRRPRHPRGERAQSVEERLAGVRTPPRRLRPGRLGGGEALQPGGLRRVEPGAHETVADQRGFIASRARGLPPTRARPRRRGARNHKAMRASDGVLEAR